MKYAILLAGLLSMASFAHADAGDSADRDEVRRVSAGNYNNYTRGSAVYLHRTAAGCSNAGDETARPVYRTKKGRLVFAGYECVQDNRGGNGG